MIRRMYDLARNSYIVRFILGSIWKETERRLGTCASREPQNSEKAEKRSSFARKTPVSREIRFYVSITQGVGGGRSHLYADSGRGFVALGEIKLAVSFGTRPLRSGGVCASTGTKKRGTVWSWPRPAPPAASNYQKFYEPRYEFCHLFAQARRKFELIDYLLICNVACLEDAGSDRGGSWFHLPCHLTSCADSNKRLLMILNTKHKL